MAQANLKLVEPVVGQEADKWVEADAAYERGQQSYLDWCKAIAKLYAEGTATQEQIAGRYEKDQSRVAQAVAIGKDQRIISNRNTLPASEKTIYLLTTLADDAFNALCKPGTTQAVILEHKKRLAVKKEKQVEVKVEQKAEPKKPKVTLNSLATEHKVPSGDAQNKWKNEVATLAGFRKATNDEEVAKLEEAARVVTANKGKTIKQQIEETRAEIKTLSETKQQQFARLEATLRRQITAELEKTFWDRVCDEVEKSSPERFANCDKAEKKAIAEVKKWQACRNGIKAQLTKDEYRFLRQTIAPDRYPLEFQDKLTKAAAIINRFDTYVESFKD